MSRFDFFFFVLMWGVGAFVGYQVGFSDGLVRAAKEFDAVVLK